MSKRRKTLGLVLGAGGARGACHIGVIKMLIENDVQIDYITGCSMGAVIGGMFASGRDIYDVEESISKVKMTDILDVNVRVIKSGGFFNGKKAEKIISQNLSCQDFSEVKIPFKCVAVDIQSGNPVVFSSGPLLTAIRASMSIPGVFEPVVQDGMILVDGGVLCRLPIDAMEEFKPDVMVLVDALGAQQELDNTPNIFQMIFRAFEVVDWKNTKKNYERGDVVILPNMEKASQFTVKTVPKAIEAGEIACLAKIAEIKNLLKN